ncbi:tRNA (cytidine(34)-2'-O)-methyltransferase [Olavius algarvensis spirochete endosymbiont]|uniref:tRNA (cytidine(34)-2'-O)-methyltransferase n=1 Tax=Olavius algarvensis spirochete endosymbiont TaxID=260710 RepID=UPI000F14E3A7|nr:tRNA (cytidine(34)-2'-O)-methyltransferase [Olavius algarvensis spirochete endosymbiont]CAD7840813.1 MAG: tRNA (cytidine(34)-2'-O)-methyltransferase (EC 2.1.1.207) [Olavius algarvensis spirochete endosymbiont]VDA99059.1 tRNA (cytidine(34)-2'-O)-methyltransferase [Olavius algarvensis spirochete endosymbiont]
MELHIVLHQPEIPQNTGSIGRTCMAMDASLHLIHPLGFSINDKLLRRAGLDYWHELDPSIYENWESFLSRNNNPPLWYLTTKASRSYDEVAFRSPTYLVFGKETAGLPMSILSGIPEKCLRIPMLKEARSLNLSVAVGIVACEVLRQHNFSNLQKTDPQNRLSDQSEPIPAKSE